MLAGDGIVELPIAAAKNLPESLPAPNNPETMLVYGVSVFHQLHCLVWMQSLPGFIIKTCSLNLESSNLPHRTSYDLHITPHPWRIWMRKKLNSTAITALTISDKFSCAMQTPLLSPWVTWESMAWELFISAVISIRYFPGRMSIGQIKCAGLDIPVVDSRTHLATWIISMRGHMLDMAIEQIHKLDKVSENRALKPTPSA